MNGTQPCLLLVGILLLLHSTTQFPSFRSTKCPDTPRPVNKSIKACWDYTRKLETTVLDNTDVKKSVCLDVISKYDNHQLGIEIMRTSKIIYCYGIMKGSQFKKEEFTYPINHIMQSKSEIMEDPDICVLDGDYKDLDCRGLDYSVYGPLYEAIVEQSRLLEGLFIATNDDGL